MTIDEILEYVNDAHVEKIRTAIEELIDEAFDLGMRFGTDRTF